jgi:hypothetical protein
MGLFYIYVLYEWNYTVSLLRMEYMDLRVREEWVHILYTLLPLKPFRQAINYDPLSCSWLEGGGYISWP